MAKFRNTSMISISGDAGSSHPPRPLAGNAPLGCACNLRFLTDKKHKSIKAFSKSSPLGILGEMLWWRGGGVGGGVVDGWCTT